MRGPNQDWGTFARVLVSVIDITGRRRTEEALRQYAERLKAIPRLRALLPEAAIIVLTSHHDQAYREAALAAGAHDFVPKRSLDTDLLPAICRRRKSNSLRRSGHPHYHEYAQRSSLQLVPGPVVNQPDHRCLCLRCRTKIQYLYLGGFFAE